MARTEVGAQLSQQHRASQLAVRAAAIRDLLRLWGGVDPLDLAGTIGLFAAAAAVVVQARNRDSSALSVRYFEQFRQVEGVAGLAVVVPPEPPPTDVVQGLVRGAGLSGIMNARRRGFSPRAAARNGFVRVAGTSSNLVLNGGRQVVTDATATDPMTTGRWQRVASPEACAFCAMLASRGPAFVARTAAFEAHADCSCVAEPVFAGSELPESSRVFRQQWEQAQRDVLPDVSGTANDALNAFRRLREGRT